MNQKQQFNEDKAIEALVYISHHCPDVYAALKVMYFADKAHLANYGRLIYGEGYVAMKHGPVPSALYDMVKTARDIAQFPTDDRICDAVSVIGNVIHPKRPANQDYLSESEIEAIDAAINQYGGMTFGQLKTISHKEPAYMASDENDIITLEALAKSVPDGELLLEYLAGE